VIQIMHRRSADQYGRRFGDPDDDEIGKLVDDRTHEPMFGAVKEGVIDRRLTFVPLGGSTMGPDNVQLAADESSLYHQYQLNYTPPSTESSRRPARR
jgi:hypothetical protein